MQSESSSVRARELLVGDRILERVMSGPPPAATPHHRIDTAAYTDEATHTAEVAAIAHHPSAALASSELSAPGAFATVELAGQPVILTRDREGIAHAMINACAHRGATVEQRPSGTARILSCGFHGWSYDLDGSLRAVADAPLFSTQTCEAGLRTLVCEERHGIIWVTAKGTGPDGGVAGWLGSDIDRLFDDLGLAAMTHHASTDYDLHCNWKLLTDGFLEIYHLKYLHRDSIAPYFPANTMIPHPSERHFLGWLPKTRLLRHLNETEREEWQVYRGLTGATVLVPGTVVQWQAGHVELFSLRPHPTDPTRSTVRLTMLVPQDRSDETELWDRNWERVCETIPAEDFAAAVDVQRNIDIGAVRELQIGANEHTLVQHLDAVRACARPHAWTTG